MATSLVTNYSFRIGWTFTSTTANDVTTDENSRIGSGSTTDGTTSGKADRIYRAQLALAGGAVSTLDLAGSLTDAFGSTITMASVRMMQFTLSNTCSASSVTIGNASATAFEGWVSAGGTVTVQNGGHLIIGGETTVYTVGAGSTDKLKFLNDDGSDAATIDMVIIGKSA